MPIALFLALTRGVWPLLVWRSTHYVFTDERILLQDGVIARERRDLPLNRVNDHVMSQSLLDRMLGCGTLRIDSIGDQSAVLASVPHVQQVQTLLYELIETDRELRGDEDEDDERAGARAGPGPPAVSGRRCRVRRRAAERRSPWPVRSSRLPSASALSSASPATTSSSVDRGLVAVDRRLEEDERAVGPEAEDRRDRDAEQGDAHEQRSCRRSSVRPKPYLPMATAPDWMTMPTRLKPKNSVYSRRRALRVWCR